MKGYKIIALTDKAKQLLIKQQAQKKNKVAVIEVVSENPYTISVLFNKRYKIVNFIKEDIIHLWAQRDLPFCNIGRDYNIEVLE